MNEWETMTVHVEDIQHSDEISFGGVWLRVERVSEGFGVTDVILESGAEVPLIEGIEVQVRRPIPPELKHGFASPEALNRWFEPMDQYRLYLQSCRIKCYPLEAVTVYMVLDHQLLFVPN